MAWRILGTGLIIVAVCAFGAVTAVGSQGADHNQAAPPAAATPVDVTTFPFDGVANGIVTGPDGNLWFGDGAGWHTQVARITPAGEITTFQTTDNGTTGMVVGSDGALWFSEYGPRIGRITTDGVLTEFSLPGKAWSAGMTVADDGSLWLVMDLGHIGRLTTTGQFTSFAMPSEVFLRPNLVAGPDGNIWAPSASNTDSRYVRVTPDGVVTTFPAFSGAAHPSSITAGPDGNLWAIQPGTGTIARVTPSGTITEYPVPAGAFLGNWITAGPDGNLWAASMPLLSITIGGVMTEYGLPYLPSSVAFGPDGKLWTTAWENTAWNGIGRATLPGGVVAPELQLPWSRTAGPTTWYLTSGPHCDGVVAAGSTCPDGSKAYALDFAPLRGTEPTAWVAAAASGVVVKADRSYVEIDHGNGFRTGYYHLEGGSIPPSVTPGSPIEVGAPLGHPGCSLDVWDGECTGEHLHFYVCVEPDPARACGPRASTDAARPIVGLRIGGWLVDPSTSNYNGTLSRAGSIRTADTRRCGPGAANCGTIRNDLVNGPPSTSVVPLSRWTVGTTLMARWSGAEGGRPIASYDVRYRKAAWNGSFGARISWKTETTETDATLTGSKGSTYCVSARARDRGGIVSPWSAETCTAIPLDDRQLAGRSSWTARTSSAYFAGTALSTKTSGRTLTRTAVRARWIALLATTCKGCGSVRVYWNGSLVKTVSLASSTTVNRKLITVITFDRVKTGTLSLKVASDKKVILDGLAVAQQ